MSLMMVREVIAMVVWEGRGHGDGRRKKAGLLISDNDVSPFLTSLPVLPSPSP